MYGRSVASEEVAQATPEASTSRRPRRRILPFLLLVGGAVLAIHFAGTAPKTQHVRFVLGPRAAAVTALEIAYVDAQGDVARQARLTYDEGAPRVVAHEPDLADGDFTLRIDLDTKEGRRSVERRVTLRGDGTTSLDLSSAIPE